MTMSQELMMAILSMDSYNREYGQGLEVSGTTVGTAAFTDHVANGISASEFQAWQSAGFYAASYSWNGQTVISNRGTNSNPTSAWAADVINGWVTGAGFAAAQADFAKAFYTRHYGDKDCRITVTELRWNYGDSAGLHPITETR